MQAFRDENVPIIERGEGFELIDIEGNRYIDGISSLWCNMHGHQVQEVDDAIREQLGKIAHTTMLGLSSPPAIQLAKALVDRAPAGLTKVFYSDSGSTAVEVAIKLAFQYHQQKTRGPEKRTTFLCMSNAYHGDTVGSVSVGGISLFHGIYGHLLFKTIQVPTPVALRTPDGYTREGYLEHCVAEMERLIREHHHEVAGFVIEPLVQGAAGIQIHPTGYLKRVRELTRQYDIPLIADEVAVGFGRTGTFFACEREEVAPDFLCLAKGISAGYLPLAATLTTDEIFSAFLGQPHEGRTFYHGHTYTGNPLACAAALASLELFEQQNLLEHIGKQTALIAEKLAPLAEHPHVGEIRQKGIMVGIELVGSREGMLAFPANARMGHQVTLEARKRGLIIRPLGDVIVLMPAPGMPLDLLGKVCDITVESIQAALELRA
ncbi:MAG: adenosylmethionine--8-amino-7-oxononanoate transaminase [Planctomyces sp.]|nr:adenosylmethionine--8-amino-7-oxononanoate transaminase [Planctomyces sp.]